ncbi:DUF4352 domain-containing protein [Nocardiopsis kunsanensis]|uniref:DUF4352 domain-containing protein n=1 Tax=Nocardiopsis kunsanensis TaxID=141693 RepID=A0A918XEX8_9ACTN|nr:DUF4352 domain-containing protein [Nocardiopsis kunsanensis]GHD28624.1 hypothetical protein GCM10007147_28730 [Nocardiopsis kunsanensis]
MPKPTRRERASPLKGLLGLAALVGGTTVLGAVFLSGPVPGPWSPSSPSSRSSPDRVEDRTGEEAVPSESPDAPVGLTVAPAEFVPAATPGPGPDGGYTTVGGPDPGGEYTTVHVTVANRTDGELDVSPSHFVLKGVSGSRHESSDAAGLAEDQIGTLTLLPRQKTSGTVSAPGSFTPESLELLDRPHGDPVHEAPVRP